MRTVGSILFLLSICFSFNIYSGNFIVDPDFVRGIKYNDFQSLLIKSPKAKEVIEKYFEGKQYKIIWAEPWGYKKAMIYFAVEVFMPEKYYFAIRKGIAVREDGKIDIIIDTKTGVFRENEKKIDFEKIGLKKGEIKCLILLQSKKNGTYWINLLDQQDNNINEYKIYSASEWFFALEIGKVYRKDDYVFSQYTMNETKDELLEIYKERIQAYRKAKAQGKAVKSAAVKTEFERLKKAGLVQEN